VTNYTGAPPAPPAPVNVFATPYTGTQTTDFTQYISVRTDGIITGNITTGAQYTVSNIGSCATQFYTTNTWGTIAGNSVNLKASFTYNGLGTDGNAFTYVGFIPSGWGTCWPSASPILGIYRYSLSGSDNYQFFVNGSSVFTFAPTSGTRTITIDVPPSDNLPRLYIDGTLRYTSTTPLNTSISSTRFGFGEHRKTVLIDDIVLQKYE
jgi:hypothetical protein